jgi:hypothetical protein
MKLKVTDQDRAYYLIVVLGVVTILFRIVCLILYPLNP